MLAEADLERYRADGFLLGPQVLDDAEVDELRTGLEATIAGDTTAAPVSMWNLSRDDDAPVWQVVDIWMASPAYRRLLSHPMIAGPAAALAGAERLRIWHDQIQYKPQAVGGVNHWHQDAPYWPVLTPQTNFVTAWIALDDVDEANGCMRMVPGSHAWGDRAAWLIGVPFDDMPATFEGNEVRVVLRPVRKGQVHFHHPLTWHGSGANRSGRPRRAVALHYMVDGTRFVASGRHVMKPHMHVADGEPLTGDAFPIVYDASSVQPSQPVGSAAGRSHEVESLT